MHEEFKKHIGEIAKLTDDEYKCILPLLTFKKLKKHQFLVQEGDRVNQTYWVRKGLLKAYFINEKGKEHILQFAMENWWISDYQAYSLKTPAILNIDCLEDTELLCLTDKNREKLCAELHKMEHYFRKKANTGFVELQRRMLSYLTNDAQKRYRLFMQTYPGLNARLPKKLIASYLGVSRETLSRIAKKK